MVISGERGILPGEAVIPNPVPTFLVANGGEESAFREGFAGALRHPARPDALYRGVHPPHRTKDLSSSELREDLLN